MADEAASAAPPPDRSVEYSYEGPDLRGHAEQLRAKREESLGMGGSDRIERQHEQGKLTVRERLDRLFDPDSFTEFSLLAHHQSAAPSMQGKSTPADGCVCGIGLVDGRRVAVIAYDFTVMAGSIGMVGELKATRMRELALRERIPIVWLIDSAGARIQETSRVFDTLSDEIGGPIFQDDGQRMTCA